MWKAFFSVDIGVLFSPINCFPNLQLLWGIGFCTVYSVVCTSGRKGMNNSCDYVAYGVELSWYCVLCRECTSLPAKLHYVCCVYFYWAAQSCFRCWSEYALLFLIASLWDCKNLMSIFLSWDVLQCRMEIRHHGLTFQITIEWVLVCKLYLCELRLRYFDKVQNNWVLWKYMRTNWYFAVLGKIIGVASLSCFFLMHQLSFSFDQLGISAPLSHVWVHYSLCVVPKH